MPLELAVWRIDGELRAVAASGLDLEERLETLLDQDVTNAAVQRHVASWRHTVERLKVRFDIPE